MHVLITTDDLQLLDICELLVYRMGERSMDAGSRKDRAESRPIRAKGTAQEVVSEAEEEERSE